MKIRVIYSLPTRWGGAAVTGWHRRASCGGGESGGCARREKESDREGEIELAERKRD